MTNKIVSPDVNMYLAMSVLNSSFQEDPSSPECVFSGSYSDMASSLECLEPHNRDYYSCLLKHEYEEYCNDKSFEVTRLY